MSAVLIFLIRFYQKLISPLFRPSCRFYPSCSSYGISCLQKYDLGAACLRIGKRICSCHPWHPGGVDLP